MDDHELLGLFLSGDRDACLTVTGWIEQVVQYRGWGVVDIDNLKGDIALATLQSLRLNRFKGEHLKAYVQGIAKNKCLEEYRRVTRRGNQELTVDTEPPDPRPNPHEQLEEAERYYLLKKVWTSTSWTCRKMLVMRMHLNLDFGEVADRLGIREGTARVRFHRCIEESRQLRISLGGV